MADQIQVKYTGTNVGKIYLSDIGKRYQLGGGQEGDYGNTAGDDQYIIWGEVLVLQKTGEVLNSMAHGVLQYFSAAPSDGSWINGAPLTLVDTASTSADEVPGRDYPGDTGRYTDAYLNRLSNAAFSTGAAGQTGYFYGNTDTPGITGASA
jgi:hypothetical protein